MNLLQMLGVCLLFSAGKLLPIGDTIQFHLLSQLSPWSIPASPELWASSTLGVLAALLFYFRDDCASMTSSFIQLILFRKTPMTLDERMPIFLGLSWIPVVLLKMKLPDFTNHWTPAQSRGLFILGGAFLLLADRLGRKMKALCDWNWKDALKIGLLQITTLLPGWDGLTTTLIGALLLNYKRDAALKYTYLLWIPVLISQLLLPTGKDGVRPLHWKDLGQLQWIGQAGLGFLISLILIKSFTKQMQKGAIKKYLTYRCLVVLLHSTLSHFYSLP